MAEKETIRQNIRDAFERFMTGGDDSLVGSKRWHAERKKVPILHIGVVLVVDFPNDEILLECASDCTTVKIDPSSRVVLDGYLSSVGRGGSGSEKKD